MAFLSHRPLPWLDVRRAHLLAVIAWWPFAAIAAGPAPDAAPDFSRMSIEDLANVQISSVSRRAEPLSRAAAAVFVITREDIRRSGATSLPEALRLAPNLQVGQRDASQYAITARGFNSTTANKLQVLIDGRTVYTPLFSGVFWDAQDVFLPDVERIEVISGPAGVLWGSNAVNGVINVITRNADATLGTHLDLRAGNRERGVGLRHGVRLGDDASLRLYAKGERRDATTLASGANASDRWDRQQAGLRWDWSRAGDSLTLQGDVYQGDIDQPLPGDKSIDGSNLLGRWSRDLGSGAALQLQLYHDRTRRVYPGVFAETLATWDVDLQHRWQNAVHEIVWGGGYRHMRGDVTNTPALAFLPARRILRLSNVFVQDEIALDPHWRLTLGGKLEHNDYTGLEFQPSVRLARQLPGDAMAWAAVSRVVRTPSRLDREFFLPGQAPFAIAGGPDFESEKVTAVEWGYRFKPSSRSTFSVSAYHNTNRNLRSVEPRPGGGSVLANKMEGDSRGLEAWGSYQVREGWRVSAGYSYLHKQLRFRPDSGDTVLRNAGNDPRHQLLLRSSWNLAHDTELDVGLRAVSALPDPAVPGYVGLDARLGWTVRPGLRASVTARQFQSAAHAEFGELPGRSRIGRSLYLQLSWSLQP